jgi:hypothetical protein
LKRTTSIQRPTSNVQRPTSNVLALPKIKKRKIKTKSKESQSTQHHSEQMDVQQHDVSNEIDKSDSSESGADANSDPDVGEVRDLFYANPIEIGGVI